jgi:hypothetical protein
MTIEMRSNVEVEYDLVWTWDFEALCDSPSPTFRAIPCSNADWSVMSPNRSTPPPDEWLRRYLDEYLTLEETAQIVGNITREGVRHRLRALGITPRSNAETYRLRELRDVAAHGDAIRDTFLRTRDVSETATTQELSTTVITRYLDREVPDWRVLTRVPRDVRKRFSREEMLASLREASIGDALPLTTKRYKEFYYQSRSENGHFHPGAQTIIMRFGSWNSAVSAAGLLANPQGGPPKEFAAADGVRALVECWRELGIPPSAAAYDSWQVGRPGMPSAATVRKLFDSWPSLQIRAWQIVNGVVLDQDDEDVSLPIHEQELLHEGYEQLVDYKRSDEGAVVSLPGVFDIGDYNALERAVRSHARIQNAIALAAQTRGLGTHSPAASGPAFDLALTSSDSQLYVVEVKSATSENLDMQMRLGLGQVLFYAHRLLEYSGKVVPVLAIELAPSTTWRNLLASLGVGLIVETSLETDLGQVTQ